MASGFQFIPDNHLVRQAAKGSRAAQHQLFAAFYSPVFRLTLVMTGNEADARDLTQDAFIKAFGSLKTLREPSRFGSWLKRLVIHLVLDRFKGPNLTWVSADTIEPDWHGAVERLAELDNVETLLAHLNDQDRLLVWLHAVEGFEHRELAAMLGIKEAAVRQRYRRALAQLAKWAQQGDWLDD
ncbi:RNA polymerase sigma factor [Gallaecimonas mangrovi]|uniref:RNA polymerase sigma factor n=1 Tax=Gallaecimonas mangrovi TaxID=2291597 RepID=UPI000E203AC9|nr:RNA polymerase sigma factor [Gallaecimonas mangrovi]